MSTEVYIIAAGTERSLRESHQQYQSVSVKYFKSYGKRTEQQYVTGVALCFRIEYAHQNRDGEAEYVWLTPDQADELSVALAYYAKKSREDYE